MTGVETVVSELRTVDAALAESARQIERARDKLALTIGAILTTERHEATEEATQ